MVRVRLLVSRDIEDQPHAAGAEVDVSDEVAADLRSAGAASLIEDEEKAEAAAREGNYGARVEREDVASTQAEPKAATRKAKD